MREEQLRREQELRRQQYARQVQEEALRRRHYEEQQALRESQIKAARAERARAAHRKNRERQYGDILHRSTPQHTLRAKKQKLHEQKVKRVLAAIITIQRFWRQVLQNRKEKAAQLLQSKKEVAASRVTAAVRKAAAIKSAKKILDKLAAIATIRSEADTLINKYEHVFSEPVHNDKGGVQYDLLAYTDGLEKVLLKLDGILAGGVDCIREKRKSVSNYIQDALALIDDYKLHGDEATEESSDSDTIADDESTSQSDNDRPSDMQVDDSEDPMDLFIDPGTSDSELD